MSNAGLRIEVRGRGIPTSPFMAPLSVICPSRGLYRACQNRCDVPSRYHKVPWNSTHHVAGPDSFAASRFIR